MKKALSTGVLRSAIAALGLVTSVASAATVPVRLNTLVATTTLASPFLANDNLVVDALITNATGSFNQQVTFTVGAGVNTITGFGAWEVTGAATAGPRLVGVNIDIFDSSNALLVSDSSVTVVGGFATSSISVSGVTPGTYRMVATGTGVRASSLDASLNFASVTGFAAKTVPVTSNALNQTSTIATPFAVDDTLFLNTLVTDETGALSQTVNFTVAAGVQGLTGEASWEISTASSTAPRLIGVNIDIFDSSNVLVASDTLVSTANGFAISNLAGGGLFPGNYKLVATGTGVRDSLLNVSLTFTGVVPEPVCGTLLLAGMGLMSRTRRRNV